MKRVKHWLTVLTLIFLVSSIYIGCSSEPQEGKEEVEYNYINIPLLLIAGEDTISEKEIQIICESEGYLEGSFSEGDSYVTFKVTRKQYENVLSDFKKTVNMTVKEVVNGKNKVEAFKRVEFNDEIDTFKVYVDANKYTAKDIAYTDVFFYSGTFYQMISGLLPEETKVTVEIIDKNTNKILISPTFDGKKQALEKISYELKEISEQ